MHEVKVSDGNGDIAPLVLNLDIRWRQEIDFMPRLLPHQDRVLNISEAYSGLPSPLQRSHH